MTGSDATLRAGDAPVTQPTPQSLVQSQSDPVAPIKRSAAHSPATHRTARLRPAMGRGMRDGAAAGGTRIVTHAAPSAVTHPWIYAIQAGEGGPIKIGTTVDPSARLKTLQTASPTRLQPVALWTGPASDERVLHQYFADQRLEGEWFSPTPELLALLRYLDRASCEWHPPEKCLAGLPGTCPSCGVEFET